MKIIFFEKVVVMIFDGVSIMIGGFVGIGMLD